MVLSRHAIVPSSFLQLRLFTGSDALDRVLSPIAVMESWSQSITHAILSAYYPTVKKLHDYVPDITGQNMRQRDVLTHETDTLRYRQFLDEIIIATHRTTSESRILQISRPIGHIREVSVSRSHCCYHGRIIFVWQVIERVQITLLKQKASTKNLLTTGYRLVSVAGFFLR